MAIKKTLVLLYVLAPVAVQAALLSLVDAPITTQASNISPNVFFQVDDSGSMDFEFMMKPYYLLDAYDLLSPAIALKPDAQPLKDNEALPVATCGGVRRTFGYIYNDTANVYSTKDNLYTLQNCRDEAIEDDWRLLCSAVNVIYYDPDKTYEPWQGHCGKSGNTLLPCENADFSAAYDNPWDTKTKSSRNLSGSQYTQWINPSWFGGSVHGIGLANGLVNPLDAYFKITLTDTNAEALLIYRGVDHSGVLPIVFEQQQPCGGSPPKKVLSDQNACYNILGTTEVLKRIAISELTCTSTGAPGCRTLQQARDNFANWYQYQHRRYSVVKSFIADVLTDPNFETFQFGLATFNGSLHEDAGIGTGIFIPLNPKGRGKDQTEKILNDFFSHTIKNSPTPTLTALFNTGQYFEGKYKKLKSPIQYACQQNYTLLVTDGYWDDTLNSVGDRDRDGIANILADIALYYYERDLAPTLKDQVPPNPWDPATWQHLVTYGISFGALGNLVDPKHTGWPDPPLKENQVWGANPKEDLTARIDDLWHAAFNSKGFFINALEESGLQNALSSILYNIIDRAAMVAPVTQNSHILNTSSKIFQSSYTPQVWTGDVMAYAIDIKGQVLNTPLYSASCMLTGGQCTAPVGNAKGIGFNDRVILTRDWSGDNRGIAFRFPSNYQTYNNEPNMQFFMKNAPYAVNTTQSSQITANQDYGNKLLNYLRGERSYEEPYDKFRKRVSILGDIVDSSPTYVAAPSRYYPSQLESQAYSSFKTTYANRTSMLYVGANDGMIHGFEASTGKEKMAYVPGASKIYKRLSELSLPTYAHRFFADATPTEGDAFINGSWKTVLVSALGNGGQSISALDITDPDNFSENNAKNIYLWEFNDTDDRDLGYVYGSPIIARVRWGSTPRWVVIVNNGYNNSENDGYASTTGKAALLIIPLDKGPLEYVKISIDNGTQDSPTTPNGLSTPYAVDLDGDYVVDLVYAGDIKGNLWRFDLRDTNVQQWKMQYKKLFSTSSGQPITAPPVVGIHPEGIAKGVMVYFGTGKFLETIDASIDPEPTTQAFYGIWDKLQNKDLPVTMDRLLAQEILGTVSQNDSIYRIVSNTPIQWQEGSQQHHGWYLPLKEKSAKSNFGEKQVSPPLLRNGNVVFATLYFPSTDCGDSAASWLMEINASTGGAPARTSFDTNNDGVFDGSDNFDFDTGNGIINVPAGGVASPVGAISTPTVFLTEDKSKEVKIITGTSGIKSIEENPSSSDRGRQNWRPIF